MKSEPTLKIGQKVIAKISGFQGIITAQAEYLTGCRRYGVTAEGLTEKGEPKEPVWFDEDQLTDVPVAKRKGGPMDAPSLRQDAPTH